MTHCRRTWHAPVLEALLPVQLTVRRWNLSFAGEASMARRQYPSIAGALPGAPAVAIYHRRVRTGGLVVRRQWAF